MRAARPGGRLPGTARLYSPTGRATPPGPRHALRSDWQDGEFGLRWPIPGSAYYEGKLAGSQTVTGAPARCARSARRQDR